MSRVNLFVEIFEIRDSRTMGWEKALERKREGRHATIPFCARSNVSYCERTTAHVHQTLHRTMGYHVLASGPSNTLLPARMSH